MNVQELVLRITGDASGAKASLGDIGGALKDWVENPVAAAKSALGGLAESMGPVGVGLTVVATTALAAGTALMELGQQATATAAELQRVSLTSGIAVPALSDLKFAVEATGGSLEQLNNVMFMFEQRMENSSAKVEKGLQMIGLSLASIEGMSHDQQILAISTAMQSVGEDVNKAAVAMDIFGRQGRTLLPELMQPLGELADKAKALGGITAEAAAQAHEFEIAQKTMAAESSLAWTQLGLMIAPVTNAIVLGFDRMKLVAADAALTIGDLVTGVGTLTNALMALSPSARDSATALERLKGELPPVASSLKGLADGSGLAAKGMKQYWDTISDTGAPVKLWEALENSKEAQRDLDAETKQHIATVLAYDKAVQALVDTLEGNNKKENETLDALQRVAKDGLVLGTDAANRFAEAIKKLTTEGVDVGPVLRAQAKAAADAAVNFKAATMEAERLDEIDRALMVHTTSLLPVLADWAKAMPQLGGEIDDTMVSIGDLTPMVYDFSASIEAATKEAASFGETLSTNLDASLKRLPQLISQAFTGGGGLSGAVKAFGADLGGSLGKTVVGKIGSTITETLGQTFGGALNAVLPGIGSLLGAGLGALFKIGGPSKTELEGRGAEKTFQDQFGSFSDMMAKVGQAYAATGRSAQQAQGDVKALMDAEKQGGAAVKTASDVINKALTEEQAKVKDIATGVGAVQAAFTAAGGHIPDSMKATIQALLQMNGLTETEATALKGMADGGVTDFAKLTQTASTYGVSLEALGPKFEQANIDASAKKIYNDFEDLKTAGADVGGVLSGMSGAISKLVSDSKKFGTAIPDNMKPLIENLAASGKLVDENGAAITDVASISFEATPLDTSLKSLNETLQRLIDTLNNVPAAAAAAANSIGNIPQPPNYGGLPGAGTEPVPSFAGRPLERVTSRGYALLHPGDVVGVPKRGQLGGGMTVNVNVAGNVWTERDLAQAIMQHTAEHFMQVGPALPLNS